MNGPLKGLAFAVTAAMLTQPAGASILGGGDFHSAVVAPDHTVWTWGASMFGQLGNGTFTTWYAVLPPVRAAALRNVADVAVGSSHTLALDSRGIVWAWGDNLFGELGDGSRVRRSTPVRVKGLNDVAAIAAGYLHSVALKRDGSVWTWGNGLHGQLGDGERGDQPTPVRIALPPVRAIAAGFHHTIAIDRSGAVWTWGQNTHAQLGDGTHVNRDRPVRVEGVTGAIRISGGQFHTLALLGDGTVMSWGGNIFGQLGYSTGGHLDALSYVATAASVMASSGTSDTHVFDTLPQVLRSKPTTELASDREHPTVVAGLPPVIQVAAGEDFSLALAADHSVWGWGDNLYGQLGDGAAESNKAAPVRARFPGEATEIAAGYSHALAVRADGSLFTWGFNTNGQLGDGRSERRFATPTLLESVSLRPIVYDATFLPYTSAREMTKIGHWESSRLLIKGLAPSPFAYVASFRPVKAGPGTPRREFVAEGDLKAGGITVGVQAHDRWIYFRNVDQPGPFVVRWTPPADEDYAVVIAHFAEKDRRATELEFTHLGWLGAAGEGQK